MSFFRRLFIQTSDVAPRTFVGNAVRAGIWLLSSYSAAILFGNYVVTWSDSYGPSMYPTIPSDISKTIYSARYRHGRDLRVGDVVNAYSPYQPRQIIGKRIIGMPGDYVLRDPPQEATAGGAPMPGIVDYIEDEREEPEMVQVPEGHVWLVGDNLAWSRDSRFYGPVPMALITGKSLYNGNGFFSWTSLRGDQLRRAESMEDEDDYGNAQKTSTGQFLDTTEPKG